MEILYLNTNPKSLTEAKAGWIDFISQQLVKYIKNNFQDINLDKLESEVYEIKTFITLKLESLLQHKFEFGDY